MTAEQERLLNELLFNNVATKSFTLFDGKVNVVIASLGTEEQLQVEQSLDSVKGTPMYSVHVYLLKLLSKSIRSYQIDTGDTGQNIVFKTADDAEKFLKKLPAPILDAMLKQYTDFQTEIAKLVSPEKIEENFSKIPSTDAG